MRIYTFEVKLLFLVISSVSLTETRSWLTSTVLAYVSPTSVRLTGGAFCNYLYRGSASGAARTEDSVDVSQVLIVPQDIAFGMSEVDVRARDCMDIISLDHDAHLMSMTLVYQSFSAYSDL